MCNDVIHTSFSHPLGYYVIFIFFSGWFPTPWHSLINQKSYMVTCFDSVCNWPINVGYFPLYYIKSGKNFYIVIYYLSRFIYLSGNTKFPHCLVSVCSAFLEGFCFCFLFLFGMKYCSHVVPAGYLSIGKYERYDCICYRTSLYQKIEGLLCRNMDRIFGV